MDNARTKRGAANAEQRGYLIEQSTVAPGCPWPVFSDYEIRHGFILPTHDASIEKRDVWKLYEEARETDKPAPYEQLIDIVDLLCQDERSAANVWTGVLPQAATLMDAEQRPLPADAEKAILKWTKRYGLLGLALHENSVVRLPAVWTRNPTQMHQRSEFTGSDLGCATITLHRSPAGWGRRILWNPELRAPKGTKEWSRVRIELLPEQLRRYVEPSIVRNLGSEGDFRTDWACYFPGLNPEKDPFPHVPETAFWCQYAEPIGRWWTAAWLFRSMLAQEPSARGKALRHFVLSSGLCLTDEDDDPKITPCSPSLFAALGLMAAHDFVAGTLHQCAARNCSKLFFSRHGRARFCSTQCKGREAQQEYRDRERKRAKR